jgi:hypothetical protein
MKRSQSIVLLALLAFVSSAAPSAHAADPEELRQKLEKIKADREKARAAARAAASQQPAATAAPTATTAPAPTATAQPTTTAAPTASAAPKASAAPSAVPAASASATATASASVTPAALGIDQLRKTRADRKHREAQNLRDRWGELVGKDAAKAELRQHAQRLAYLQRIRQLAESKNDSKLVESVDKLITEEERRDADAMNALRTSAAANGARP